MKRDKKTMEYYEQDNLEIAFSDSLVTGTQVIMILLDTHGRIIQFNQYLEEISGYKLEEVQGKDWFDTFMPEQDQLRLTALFQRAINGTQTSPDICPILTKDNFERIFELYYETFENEEGKVIGLRALGIDITEIEQAEKALQRSEARLLEVLRIFNSHQLEKGEDLLYNHNE